MSGPARVGKTRSQCNGGGEMIMRKKLFAASMMALSVAVAPACATKKFVRTEVGNVNTKVDTLGGTVEETQQRVAPERGAHRRRRPEGEAAGKSAAEAQTAATAHGAPPTRPRPQATGRRRGGRTRSRRSRAASRRLIYEVTLSEDQGNFKFGKADLPDEARARARPDGRPAEGRPEERLHRDRGPHRQRRRHGRSTSSSAWSAPRR